MPALVVREGRGEVAAAQLAPGQLLRHYAPAAALTLFEGAEADIQARLGSEARTRVAQGQRVGILAPEEDVMALAPVLAAQAASGRVLLSSLWPAGRAGDRGSGVVRGAPRARRRSAGCDPGGGYRRAVDRRCRARSPEACGRRPGGAGLTTRARSALQFAAPELAVQLQRVADDLHGFLGAEEVLDHDLLVLEHLVVLEEPPDLAQQVRRQLRLWSV